MQESMVNFGTLTFNSEEMDGINLIGKISDSYTSDRTLSPKAVLLMLVDGYLGEILRSQALPPQAHISLIAARILAWFNT